MRPAAHDIRSILLCSSGELLGDAVRKLPFLHAVRACYPKAHITWLTARDGTALAQSMYPLSQYYIDDFIESLEWWKIQDLFLPLPKALKKRKFDLVIDTQRVWYRSFLTRRIPFKALISSGFGFGLSTWKPSSEQTWPDNLNERLLFLLSLSLKQGVTLPDYSPPKLEKKGLDLAARLLPEGKCVGLVPGAGNKKKCWPLDQYLALGKSLLDKGVRPVIFLGPGEVD